MLKEGKSFKVSQRKSKKKPQTIEGLGFLIWWLVKRQRLSVYNYQQPMVKDFISLPPKPPFLEPL